MMKKNMGRLWTRDELIVAVNFYCKTPFGKLHRQNLDIIILAKQLHRTPSSLAMKLVNFASIDPLQRERKIKGLGNISKLDLKIWQEFFSNWEQLAYESQKALLRLQGTLDSEPPFDDFFDRLQQKETESKRLTRVRLVQGFFRAAILSSYEFKCSFCDLELTQLLSASHIIPWKDNVIRRADPTNGICLCALHDRAFDRGILGVDDNYKILVSSIAKKRSMSIIHKVGLLEIEGKHIMLPKRFKPDQLAIEFHRRNIFLK